MDIPLPKSPNTNSACPAALPTGERVYRRPSPPPSQQQSAATDSPQRLPLGPPPAPPATALELPRPAAPGKPSWGRRVGWLILPSAVVGILLGLATVWLATRDAQLAANRNYEDIARNIATNDRAAFAGMSAAGPDAVASSADLDFALFEDSFADFANASSEVKLTGASLLASRYYELQTNDAGHIVAARMPLQEGSGRFGPPMDEITALLELPHLERLDLGNTLASAALPVANRHPNLKVLVLHDQADAASLRRVREGVQVQIVSK